MKAKIEMRPNPPNGPVHAPLFFDNNAGRLPALHALHSVCSGESRSAERGRERVRPNGFTLVDMLVALLLLTIGLLGMAKLTIAIMDGNQASNNVTQAAIVAETKMETIRRQGYKGIADEDTTTVEDFNSIPNYPDFQRITYIDADAPVEGIKTVTIAVNWKKREYPKTLVISTMLTK